MATVQLAALNLHTVVNGRPRWDSVDRLTKAAKTVSRKAQMRVQWAVASEIEEKE